MAISAVSRPSLTSGMQMVAAKPNPRNVAAYSAGSCGTVVVEDERKARVKIFTASLPKADKL